MLDFAKKVFGSSNERAVKRYLPRVQRINSLEHELEALTDEELRAKTVELKERVAAGATLDEVLCEAFAAAREGAKRALGMRHFDVQLIGGMVLHEGDIAEMRTGEGKTLVATLPAYLNALSGKGVHVVTVNDYLASRDAEWMGKVYRQLGLTVGVIKHGLTDAERQEAYACDITYGTNNEFGFDYLRDNMKYSLMEMCQRGHNFAIVDEVDSILVDESRTPLIISGPTDDRSDFYRSINELIPHLQEGDYEIDEKQRSVTLTEEGNEAMEELLEKEGMLDAGSSMYDVANVSLVHHVNQALRAHRLYIKNKDYIVKNDQVVLIDEFTGRMMDGRRLSEGLHQAIEAKEGVAIQPENVTLASITFQNYFRLYSKLAGMTGTAATEAAEFQDIYGLSVVEIPTNKPVARKDDDDEVYRTMMEKYAAIVAELADAHRRGQPVLVGTVSIEKSEELSELLSHKTFIRKLVERVRGYADESKDTQEKERFFDIADHLEACSKAAKGKGAILPHQVLNARYHEQEARIIAQAGAPGAITIATNMAGRGTDIQLGGNVDMALEEWLADQASLGGDPNEDAIAKQRKEFERQISEDRQRVLDAGGLYVVASERHESRRIDNQLRGRTGRQGDIGRSKFFISLEDDLLRIFAPERLDGIMRGLGMKEGEAIIHPWMNKALETSQKRVEQRNFEIRKNLLKYDDVINDQRKAIFEQRIEFMTAEDVADVVEDMRIELVDDIVARHIPARAYAEQWTIEELAEEVHSTFGLTPPVDEWAKEEGIADEEMRDRLRAEINDAYKRKAAGAQGMIRQIEKQVLLHSIDQNWREHLQQLDHLRSVVHLRGYAQRDPLNEFKTEAFALFEKLLAGLRMEVTRILMNFQIQTDIPRPAPPQETRESHADPDTGRNAMARPAEPPASGVARTRAPRVAPAERRPDVPESWGRVGRNEPCPCGSGKKFKHCHGQVTAQV